MSKQATLKRRISLPLITFYGLGTILGAGIYVLVGKVAGAAGLLAPLAFIVAGVIAGVTGMSYAQLVTIFPKSAGEALYVLNGFGSKLLSKVVGWMLVLTGIVTCATLANGFVGYFQIFFPLDGYLIIIMLVLALGTLAAYGISESLWASAIFTLIEVAGLLFVLYISRDVFEYLPSRMNDMILPVSFPEITAMMAGAYLAFYAYIGFEDMVNVVEEVKNPRKNLPMAIFLAIAISTIIYIPVAMVVVLGLPLKELAASDAPLALLLEGRSAVGESVISAIGLFAIVNGALVQIIMASRVIYGMAKEGLAPSVLSSVNAFTRTPLRSTAVITVIILAFSLWLPLVTLAKITSFLILLIFMMINLSLWRIKKKKRELYETGIQTMNFPILGAGLCLILILFQVLSIF